MSIDTIKKDACVMYLPLCICPVSLKYDLYVLECLSLERVLILHFGFSEDPRSQLDTRIFPML